MMKTSILSIFAACAFMSCTPATANGVQCPNGDWHDDPAHCPKPAPSQPSSFSNKAVGKGGNAVQGQQQGQAQQQGQIATGGAGGSARTGNVTVNSSSRAAASSAIAPGLGGYGFPNCFGDTNPSGSFVAAFGNVFASASAGGMKASNVCAAYAIGGEELALRYLQRMDRNMPRQIMIEVPVRVSCPVTHPIYVDGKGCRK